MYKCSKERPVFIDIFMGQVFSWVIFFLFAFPLAGLPFSCLRPVTRNVRECECESPLASASVCVL